MLAQRILNFEAELFVFVECPTIPSENNAAERTFRPIVIARKLCGGTRTAKGSADQNHAPKPVVTWQLRGIDPLQAIPRLLLGHSSLTSAAVIWPRQAPGTTMTKKHFLGPWTLTNQEIWIYNAESPFP